MQQLEIWKAWSRGELDDSTAERLAEAAHALRRKHLGGDRTLAKPLSTGFANPRRRPCKSPDKQSSRERRDMLASLPALSALMAIGFSHSEKAVITVVVMQAARVGGCMACHEEIAGRAGVSVSTVKRALAKARLRGLLDRRERRRPGRPSLTNVVRIRDRELRERTRRRMEWRGSNLNVRGSTDSKQGGQASKELDESTVRADVRGNPAESAGGGVNVKLRDQSLTIDLQRPSRRGVSPK